MNDLKLKIGCYHYDHTRALFDGTVKIDGIDATANVDVTHAPEGKILL